MRAKTEKVPLSMNLSTALGAAILLALAQPAAAQPQGTRAVAGPVAFDIAPQPLADAITAFGLQSGYQVSVDQALLKGRWSPGVTGAVPATEGLSRLLAGTGVKWRLSDSRSVVLEADNAPANDAMLAPVRASGTGLDTRPAGMASKDGPKGPAGDYVAKRSAVGTKTDTPIIETPQSISVITREELTDHAVQSIAQSLRYAPGVVSEPRGVMTGLDYFYARGFQINQYLDGLRTLSGEYSYPQPDPYMLERVEVLRGPATVLYGQADPGGVVNLVTKHPGTDPFAEIQFQAGSNNRFQGGIDLGGALNASHTLMGRITAVLKDSDTQVDFAHERRIAVAPALTWQPSDSTSLTVLALYQDDPDVGYYNWIPAHGTALPNSYRPGEKLPTSLYTGEPDFDRWSRKTYMIGYEFEHRFSDAVRVRQNMRYAHARSFFDNIYSSFLDSDDHTLYRYAWHLNDDADNFDVDSQLQLDFSTGPLDHTLLVGVDYQNLRYRQQLGYDFATVPTLDLFDPVYHQPIATPPLASDALQHRKQLGLYAQDQIALGGLRIMVGGRQDWVRTSTTQRIDDNGDYFEGVTEIERQNAFTARAGAVYLFENGLAPYASYAESFQPQTGTDFAGTPFKPTTGRQFEAGLKFQPGESRSLITLSVYQLEQQNVLSADEEHPGQSVQAGEIRSRGIELWGVASLAEGLDINASYAHVAQLVTKGAIDFGPQAGKHPSSMPKDQLTVWLDYRPQAAGLEGLGMGAGVRYMGKSWGDDDNSFRVRGRALVDAVVHYDFTQTTGVLSGLRLAVNVNNLFDKKYVSGCSGLDYCGYGFRRTVLGTISKRI